MLLVSKKRTAMHTSKKIIIAMDSFKGCLTSTQAGNAVAEGIMNVFPHSKIILLPVSDGGDGMLDACTQAVRGEMIHIEVCGPLLERHNAYYGISPDKKTAIIEMAVASGLASIPQEKQNPMYTTSYGTGQLIRDALDKGCRKFIIGLGGSATNDGGLGMLQALGVRFLNSYDEELCASHTYTPASAMHGALLAQVERIDTSAIHPAIKDSQFIVACDVQSPFYGPNGAAYVFAPQKGANPQEVKTLDEGLQHLAEIICDTTGKDISQLPGAGAAGGMGGSMVAFFHAKLIPGAQLILDMLDFRTIIQDADFIITGEGKSDRQTLMGKIPSGILSEAIRQNIPVILLSGSIENVDELNRAGFAAVFSSTPAPLSLAQATESQTAFSNLRSAAEQLGRLINLYDIPPAKQ